ncbi:DUF2793 domain-containing protein [Oharaeibacter diazotrophicus]|uniref:Uncharacterized protein DUF2793 n=2 Tax=Oharaeibacter diazotrophicus TaxID=1920512 RepID=A0A4R6RAZ2_9HYPH|nr:DUF2793 domain-containing protein [Oharaeibacter diazotrophicus]TDP83212.1 uncharacterized protein DUF2793 [Oharaeibacter diazotrophicus]BBE72041.1 hypothetical protein OHA_1_01628 [Pleomorphomonas sp. SM30]GLS78806.1 hypothetical protein GCM10007904_41430 [Oharaeibacter diazotrophicus]
MSDTTDRLQLPRLAAAQAQKHVTHNDALAILDALVQLAVADRDLTAPPASPAAGERHLVAAGATGAWAGRAGEIAEYLDGAWRFHAPRAGWTAYVAAEGAAVVYDGTGWTAAAGEGAAAILAKLLTVDGAGSGLDADRLGGIGHATLAAASQARASIAGGGTLAVSAAGEVSWSARYVVGAGRGAQFAPAGSFDVVCPTSGTVTGVGGAADRTATSAGVALAAFETLYFVPPVGGATAGAADFRVCGGSADFAVPGHWIALARRDGESGGVLFPGGVRVGLGESFAQAASTTPRPRLDRLGINAAADATNRLVAALSAALITDEGAGVQVKVNKTGAANTGALVFQTGFSGRAEFGLVGGDDFKLKVSPDGSTWTEALAVDRTAGTATLRQLALTTALAVGQGGSGARTPASARKALGLAVPNVPKRRRLTGSAWLASTSAADNDWRGVCWAAELGLFVAVGASGSGNRVMTSPDGIAWTARTSAADNNWRAVCWSPELSLLVAVGDSGTGNRVMTSPDGITWTARASAADGGWYAVCWSPQLALFVAVGYGTVSTQIMTSPDGIAWTVRTSPAANQWFSVDWTAELGLFVAVSVDGGTSQVMTSPNGIAWTLRSVPASRSWTRVRWSAELGIFVAVAASGTGTRAMTSPDGVTWTLRTTATDSVWYGLAWAPEIGLWAAVSSDGTVMTSPDGVTWTAGTSPAVLAWRSLAWSPELGLFAAVASTGSGNRAMTSVSAHAITYRS